MKQRSEQSHRVSQFLSFRGRGSFIDPTELDRLLQNHLATARSSWPAFDVSEDALIAHWASLPSAASLKELEQLAIADVYLAHACLQKHSAALQACSALIHEEVERIHKRTNLAVDAADLESTLATHLLVGSDQQPAALAQYHGRGPLRSWVQVCAVRMAVRQVARAKQPESHFLWLAEASPPSPDFLILKQRYSSDMAAAFRDALGALTTRQRNVLRQHYIDGLSLEQVAAMYKVHRITVFRWLDGARQAVLAATRQRLARSVGLSSAEVDSLLDKLLSQLDVSLTLFLSDSSLTAPSPSK